MQPHPRTAIALIQRIRQRQPRLPLLEVGTVNARIQRTAPILDVRHTLPVKAATHVERLRQLLRRRRSQPEIMLPTPVMQAQINIAQDQRGRVALRVIPDQCGMRHTHLALRQQPVAKAAFRLVTVQGDARHMQAALRIATHAKRQVIHLQGRQPQLTAQQREPRQFGLNVRQKQLRTLILAPHLHRAQTQRRMPALPIGADLPERDALPGSLADRRRNRLAPTVDVGQYPQPQRQYQQHQQQHQRQHQIVNGAPQPAVAEGDHAGILNAVMPLQKQKNNNRTG